MAVRLQIDLIQKPPWAVKITHVTPPPFYQNEIIVVLHLSKVIWKQLVEADLFPEIFSDCLI
jgi:hypothetical protein